MKVGCYSEAVGWVTVGVQLDCGTEIMGDILASDALDSEEDFHWVWSRLKDWYK